MPPRIRLMLVVVLVALLAAIPSAWAGDPSNTAPTVVSTSFDSDDGGFILSEIDSERQAAAGWGRVGSVKRGTTGASLWCAGTQLYPTVVAPSPFSPASSYPAAYYYMFQENREPITLPGTTAKALKYPGVGGAPVNNIEVWSAPTGGIKYNLKDERDYVVDVNMFGYTTIARNGLPPGTTIPHNATVYVTYKWPSAGTRGSATLDLPQLADYYRSWVSFYYLMPSAGTNDIFSMHWKATGSIGMNESYVLPLSATWKAEQRELSAGNTVSLSRVPGTLWFQFYDYTPAAGQTRNGHGPAIDDLKVSGYKYGPVPAGSISIGAGSGVPVALVDYQASYVDTATVTLFGSDAGQVKLVWGRPPSSITNPADDMRAMSYRVWRRAGTTGPWIELTSDIDRVSVREIADAPTPGQYRYAVQAWDAPGAGSAYGQYTEKDVTVPPAAPGAPIAAIEYTLDNGAPQTVNAASYDLVLAPRANPYSLSFRVRDADSNWSPSKTISVSVNASTSFPYVSGSQRLSYGVAGALSGTLKSGGVALGGQTVTLQRLSSRTTGSWINVTSKSTDPNGYVRFDIPASASGYDYTMTYYRLSFAGVPGLAGATTASRYIEPKAYLSTPWSSKSTVYAKKSYTWYVTLKPRHTSGSKPVKLLFERYSSGKYRPYKTVYASAYNYYSYSRVKAAYAIPYKGKWRVRAYHDDSGHLPTYSAWLYKTVR